MVGKEELKSMSLDAIKEYVPEQEIKDLSYYEVKGLSKEKTEYIDSVWEKKHEEKSEEVEEKKEEVKESGLKEFKQEVENDLSRTIQIGPDTVEMTMDLDPEMEDIFFQMMQYVKKDRVQKFKENKGEIFKVLSEMIKTEPYNDPGHWKKELGGKSATYLSNVVKTLVEKYMEKGESIENFPRQSQGRTL